MLEAWCESCGEKGPQTDVDGMDPHKAVEAVNRNLKPWMVTHSKKIDMGRSYRTRNGAQVVWHRPRFGPVESTKKGVV